MVTDRSVRLFFALGFGALLLLGGTAALSVDAKSVGQSDISCQVPDADSAYGDSTWSWFPPGKVCHLPHGSTPRAYASAELVAYIAVVLGLALIVCRPRRDASEPRHSTGTSEAASSLGSQPTGGRAFSRPTRRHPRRYEPTAARDRNSTIRAICAP